MANYISAEFNKSVGNYQAASDFINGIDVLQEPLLIKEVDGLFLIHERTGPTWLYDLHGKDDVEAYIEDDLVARHDTSDLMTVEQYQEIAEMLDNNRLLLDKTTRSQMLHMFERIEEIKDDMADHNLKADNVYVPSTQR